MLKKMVLIVGVAYSSLAVAGVSIYEIRSAADLVRCLQTTELVEKAVGEGGKETHRVIPQSQIIPICIDHASQLIKSSKDIKLAQSLIDATTSQVRHDLAIPLVSDVVHQRLSACNDLANYKIILEALGRPPTESSSQSSLQQAKQTVTVCLKDKRFAADFREEMTNADKTVAANVCAILKEAKAIKRCQ